MRTQKFIFKNMKEHDKTMEESSDEEDPVPDFDTCDENELNRLFKSVEPVEVQVGKGKEYILHLSSSAK